MKKIVLFLCAFLLLSAAANPEQTEVCICHKQGPGYVYKIVPEQSLKGHFKHGDFLYRGRPDVEEWEMNDWCNINADPK
jgi:hypothetical protein